MNYCQSRVFWGFIGPHTTPKITQNISKMWDEVYNDRVIMVIVLVHGLIVVWPNHWRRPELARASSPVIWPYHN